MANYTDNFKRFRVEMSNRPPLILGDDGQNTNYDMMVDLGELKGKIRAIVSQQTDYAINEGPVKIFTSSIDFLDKHRNIIGSIQSHSPRFHEQIHKRQELMIVDKHKTTQYVDYNQYICGVNFVVDSKNA